VAGVQFAQGLCWTMFPGVGRGVTCGAYCSPVGSADLYRQLWNQLAGWNSMLLFPRQTLPGTGFSVVSIGMLSMGKGSRMSQCSILVDALSSWPVGSNVMSGKPVSLLGYFTYHNDLKFYPCWHKWQQFIFLIWLNGIFFSVLGFELRVSALLDRSSTTWVTPKALFYGYF
jgi:hypothetical protein